MANIVVIEDVPTNRTAVVTKLREEGHKVVLEIDNYDDAIDAVPDFGPLGVSLVLLDCNLTAKENSGDHGFKIATAIRELYPELAIILWSSRDDYPWAKKLAQDVIKKNPYFFGPLLTAIQKLFH